MFTKDNLKTGDFIVKRNGKIGLVLRSQGIIMYETGWTAISNLKENLNSDLDREYDVIKVYRGFEEFHFTFKEYNKGILVFDRDIYDPEETIMTVSEIEKKLGVKNLKIIKEK